MWNNNKPNILSWSAALCVAQTKHFHLIRCPKTRYRRAYQEEEEEETYKGAKQCWLVEPRSQTWKLMRTEAILYALQGCKAMLVGWSQKPSYVPLKKQVMQCNYDYESLGVICPVESWVPMKKIAHMHFLSSTFRSPCIKIGILGSSACRERHERPDSLLY